jgi:membrane-associated phospholipid phosphatase
MKQHDTTVNLHQNSKPLTSGFWQTAVLTIARAISVIFHPGFQQFYLLLYFAYLHGQFTVTVLPATVFILAVPSLFYLYYKKYILKDDNMYQMKRQDRFGPLLINFLGLLLFGAFVVFSTWQFGSYGSLAGLGDQLLSPADAQVSVLQLSAILLLINLLAVSITTFYKISLHMLGTAAILFIFYFPNALWLTALLALSLLIMVGWSRRYLHGHTIDEIIVGAVTGLAFATGILAYLGQF